MLSFNIDDKILRRIERRLYSKQEQPIGGYSCDEISQEQRDELTEVFDVNSEESHKSALSYVRRVIHMSRNARNTSHIPVNGSDSEETYKNHDPNNAYVSGNNHSTNVEQVN